MPDNIAAYKATLRRCLSYIDGIEYAKDHEFTHERLAQIKPAHLMRWFNHKTFDTEDPPPDANPTHARSSSLKNWKKQLSYFMPNKHHPWNEILESGNPTRSQDILMLIKYVKKKEVRKQGVLSSARRPFEEQEFRNLLKLARNDHGTNIISRQGIPALLTFQFAMIGRIDDSTQWQKVHFKAHNQFPEIAARARLNWSKNVQEERDAPWQILLGSMDPDFCVLLNTALWLEVFLSTQPGAELSPYVLAFSNDNNRPAGGKKARKTASSILRRLLNDDEFETNDDDNQENLGSHSTRKFASTWTRRQGATKDEKDTRGRWKKRRVSDDYDDMELPYPDTKVAGMLCVGGPCSYRIKENSGITEGWILQNVVPYIARVYGNALAKTLGKALLWVIFSEHSEWVPQGLRERVSAAYEMVQTLENGVNPILKKLLVITGEDAVVQITEIFDAIPAPPDDNGGNIAEPAPAQVEEQHNGGGLQARSTRQLILALYAQTITLQRSISALNQQREADRTAMRLQANQINQNLRRLAINPLRRLNQQQQVQAQQHDGGGGALIGGVGGAEPQEVGGGDGPPADLSPTPRTLYVLWLEYQEGIGGRKPARQFTREERGRVKHKYHRRKIIWDLVASMIRTGLNAQLAYDRIYDVYGQATTVTNIINSIKRDCRNGNLHPNLVV